MVGCAESALLMVKYILEGYVRQNGHWWSSLWSLTHNLFITHVNLIPTILNTTETHNAMK